VGYPFINMIIGFRPDPLFYGFIASNVPDLYLVLRTIEYSAIFLLISGLLLVGFSNRKHYGNFMIAFAVLFLIERIFTLISQITRIHTDESYLLLQYTTFMLVVIGASYLVFFGHRLRNINFTLCGIIFFGTVFIRWFFSFIFFVMTRTEIEFYYTVTLILSLIGLVVSGRFIELGGTIKRGVRIFITHAVADYSRYRINDIAQFLENQKGIRTVFYCEADLTGNIDAWMAKTVPRCQILLFISTDKSLNSTDCATELSIAREKGITVIPVLGVGLDWNDLKELNIHRDIGANFDPMEFEEFCNALYQQIQIFKKSLNQKADDNQPEIKK
jgi:hypothetical protein